MFRVLKIRKKAKIVIELLKEYFKDRDEDLYRALCNYKTSDLMITDKEYVDKYICDEFDFVILDKDKKVILDSYNGSIYKAYVGQPTVNYIQVVSFHELLKLDDHAMCTWDMIIDYLKEVNS